MSSAPVATLVVVLTLVAVLLTSGVAKLRDPRGTQDAFDALRVPEVLRRGAAARALPWVEVALAVLLLVVPAGWAAPVALAAVLLMLAYTWLIARAIGFDEPVSCSCFGSLGRHEIDRVTLVRNALLTVLAGVALWSAVNGWSAWNALAGLDAGDARVLIATATAVAVAALVSGGASWPATTPADAEVLDYERRPIPYGVLTLAGGRTVTLSELATTQARLLVVLNPGCGPCVRTAQKLDDWAAQLAPAVGVVAIYPTAEATARAGEHASELATWEPELNVSRVFSVGTPAAILLGADGFLAGGPVAGEDAVADFVADVLAEVSVQPVALE